MKRLERLIASSATRDGKIRLLSSCNSNLDHVAFDVEMEVYDDPTQRKVLIVRDVNLLWSIIESDPQLFAYSSSVGILVEATEDDELRFSLVTGEEIKSNAPQSVAHRAEFGPNTPLPQMTTVVSLSVAMIPILAFEASATGPFRSHDVTNNEVSPWEIARLIAAQKVDADA